MYECHAYLWDLISIVLFWLPRIVVSFSVIISVLFLNELPHNLLFAIFGTRATQFDLCAWYRPCGGINLFICRLFSDIISR